MQAPAALIKKYEAKQKQSSVQNKDRFAKDEGWMQHENDWRRRLVQDNPVYAAMIENMDWNIGRMLDKLKQLNLDDNTLVIFTSDNGGLSTAEGSPTTNAPLRAGKGWLYEGGIRVPLIMYWKGRIIAGTISDLSVTIADLFPTIAWAINENYKKDKSLDGENIFRLLAKPQAYQNRKLFWHYPHYSNQGGKPGSAIRVGNYKLIYNYEDESVELYDVVKDIGEKNNIANTNSQLVKKMNKSLLAWLKQNAALYPNKNPNYRPGIPKQSKGQDE